MKHLFDLLFGTIKSDDRFDLTRRQQIHREIKKACERANDDLQRVVLDHLLQDFLATQTPDKVASLRQRFDTVLIESLPMNLTTVTDRILDDTT